MGGWLSNNAAINERVDYSDDENWAWLPGKAVISAGTVGKTEKGTLWYNPHAFADSVTGKDPLPGSFVKGGSRLVDCFYVHATTSIYFPGQTNNSMRTERTDGAYVMKIKHNILNHASAFADSVDGIYAPFYRQV